MIKIYKNTSKYVAFYLSALSIYVFFAIYLNLQQQSLRNQFFDFSKLDSAKVVLQKGLTREQVGELKLGFALHSPRPDIAVYGNHQIQYWSKVHNSGLQDFSYFNQWFANLSLSDILDYLMFLEKKEALPKKILLIQMTTPNNDNGNFIINRSNELPKDLYFAATDQNFLIKHLLKFRLHLNKIFDYANILQHLPFKQKVPIIQPLGRCGDGTFNAIAADAFSKKVILKTPTNHCEFLSRNGAMDRFGAAIPPSTRPHPIKNKNKLDPSQIKLFPHDHKQIVKALKNIIQIAQRNNLIYFFIIPPVFEDKRASRVNAIMDGVLQEVSPLNLIDHRHENFSSKYFFSYDHPSGLYFSVLSKEISDRLRLMGNIDKDRNAIH